MKTLIRVTLLLSCVVTLALGQSRDSLDHPFGLRFSFSGLYISGGLGAKLWISRVSAVALDLTVDASSSSETGYSSSGRSVHATFHYERHFRFVKDATFFVVGSPNVGYGKNSNSGIYSNYKAEYWTLGLRVGLGAEYWPTDIISLAAVQSVGYSYRFYTDRNFESSYLSAQALGLLLTIYF